MMKESAEFNEGAVQRRLQKQLESAVDTEALEIGEGVAGKVLDVYRTLAGDREAVVVADQNTYRVLGKQVVEQLRQGGQKQREPFIFGEKKLPAHMDFVERLAESLNQHKAFPIAVGSGTINDLVKLASHKTGRRYISVATAASMDGYTSFGASITHQGSKQTFFCPAPQALIADIGIISEAPESMNASGYADLLAKVTSGADWMLADMLGVEAIHTQAWSLVQSELLNWVSDPGGIRNGDRGAVFRLTEGLIMAGLGMQAAQSSRPASGAEHQFSHLWDMQGHVHNGSAPSHGFKVGIGMLACAALYEKFLQLTAEDFDPEEIARGWPGCDEIVKQARGLHALEDLAEIAEKESEAKYVAADELGERFQKLRSHWPDIRERLERQLLPAQKLREMLRMAGAPTDPSEIGITQERLQASYFAAQTIRRRYTILDTAYESHQLSPLVEHLFSGDGFWGGRSNE